MIKFPRQLFLNEDERHIIVPCVQSRCGYRILHDIKDQTTKKRKWYFVPSPDSPFGYLLIGKTPYGEVEMFDEISAIFVTYKEATEWVKEHKITK